MAQQPRASNLLQYVPDCLSKAAWDKKSALTFYKFIKDLKQMATLIPLVHPCTGNKYLANWTLEEKDPQRQAMTTYISGQGVANVALRK
jgi:hypothetical protein